MRDGSRASRAGAVLWLLAALALVTPAGAADAPAVPGASADSGLSPSEAPPDPSVTGNPGERRTTLPGIDPKPEEAAKSDRKAPASEVEGKAPAGADAAEKSEAAKAQKSGNDAALRPDVGGSKAAPPAAE